MGIPTNKYNVWLWGDDGNFNSCFSYTYYSLNDIVLYITYWSMLHT